MIDIEMFGLFWYNPLKISVIQLIAWTIYCVPIVIIPTALMTVVNLNSDYEKYSQSISEFFFGLTEIVFIFLFVFNQQKINLMLRNLRHIWKKCEFDYTFQFFTYLIILKVKKLKFSKFSKLQPMNQIWRVGWSNVYSVKRPSMRIQRKLLIFRLFSLMGIFWFRFHFMFFNYGIKIQICGSHWVLSEYLSQRHEIMDNI